MRIHVQLQLERVVGNALVTVSIPISGEVEGEEVRLDEGLPLAEDEHQVAKEALREEWCHYDEFQKKHRHRYPSTREVANVD